MKMSFTLFCREFGNVVNRAFLVLIFGVKKLVGANFTRFCNYVLMMIVVMMMVGKTYLKWVWEAEELDDKQGEVFQFRRGDTVVLTHHLL